eukprot:SAG31_NODE_4276_length_3386_cov_1.703681_3_plen_54_part_00
MILTNRLNTNDFTLSAAEEQDRVPELPTGVGYQRPPSVCLACAVDDERIMVRQ